MPMPPESPDTSEADSLIRATERGLYCEAGGFYVDPWRPVDRAVITHAHSDHLRSGCERYLCSKPGLGVLRRRVAEDARVETLGYGEATTINGVRVSLHPAGHLLGSAQVRVEHRGRVTVVSGDYKTESDPTCADFEPVCCDTFITESTFGLPVYRWPDPGSVVDEINAWWRGNQETGRTSVIFAYALGKAQRVLHAVDDSIGPIAVHGAVKRFVDVYAAAGVRMPEVLTATEESRKAVKGRGLVVAPPSALGTPWLRKFAPLSTAFASGWMRIRGARRRQSLDRGFVVSDHADWPGLLRAIDATGASRVGITHGYVNVLHRWLIEQGRDAFVVPTRYESESGNDDGEVE